VKLVGALLELEPKLAQMEGPDVPRSSTKFLDELRLSSFVLVPLIELGQLQIAADAPLKRQ
jgi:hypothetical protein